MEAEVSFSPKGQRIARGLRCIEFQQKASNVLRGAMQDVTELWRADLHEIELAKADGVIAVDVQREFSPDWEYRFAEEWSQMCDAAMKALEPPPGLCCRSIVQRLVEAGISPKQIPPLATGLYLEQYAYPE